jgi:hypothetical protein
MTARVLPRGYRPPAERSGIHISQFYDSLIDLRDCWDRFDVLTGEIGRALDALRKVQAESAAIAACNQIDDPFAGVDITVHKKAEALFHDSLEALIEALENVADGNLPKQLDFLDLISEAPMQ